MKTLDLLSDLIGAKSRVLITSHIRADGDAIGSELALALALKQAGKNVHVVNDGAVPEIYTFLPGADRIDTSAKAVRDDYDLVIVVDAADFERIGEVKAALPEGVPLINIDHHSSNEGYGDAAWIDGDASSVGEMVYKLLKHMELKVSEDIAVCIYAAIATDTGRFLHSNTTAESLRIVAEFVDGGVDLNEANNALYRAVSPGLMKLKTLAMETITLFANGRIVCMQLTKQMFQETGTSPLDAQEFVEIPRSIKGVSVAVLLYTIDGGKRTKVSFRSNLDVDVCAIAKGFGGGGHLRAAGCEIDAPIDEAQAHAVAAVEAVLCRPAKQADPS